MILQIEALYLWIIIEVSVVLLGICLYLVSRVRKYKALYRKSQAELENARSEAEEPMERTAAYDRGIREREAFPPEQEAPEEKTETEQPQEEPAVSAEEEFLDDDSLKGKVSKLQRIVNFQKGKILDLMCYKDIFEGAQKKLGVLQQNSRKLYEKITALMEVSDNKDELAGMTTLLEGNNRELESFTRIIEGENNTLSEKFSRWEEELRVLWEQEEPAPASSEGADAGRYDELLKEKEELADKVKGFEDKLQEKSTLLEEVQKQYEDMEKEYMVLYNQQQAQQQAQQPM